MIKLASNAFLATRVSFINEIANVSEAVGADIDEVAHGMGLDKRIGTSYLRPGIGYGGSCYPKDVPFLKLLAGNSGYHFQLLTAVMEVNELQKRRLVGKLKEHLGDLRGKTVALLGLAFKPHTDDMRDAPSIVLASRLIAEGADVRAWDPLVKGHPELDGVAIQASMLDAVRGADAAVIVTEWPELREPGVARDAAGDAHAADRGRPQPARSRGRARRRLPVRGHRPDRKRRESRHGSDHPRRREGRAARSRGTGAPEGARADRGPPAGRLSGCPPCVGRGRPG